MVSERQEAKGVSPAAVPATSKEGPQRGTRRRGGPRRLPDMRRQSWASGETRQLEFPERRAAQGDNSGDLWSADQHEA